MNALRRISLAFVLIGLLTIGSSAFVSADACGGSAGGINCRSVASAQPSAVDQFAIFVAGLRFLLP